MIVNIDGPPIGTGRQVVGLERRRYFSELVDDLIAIVDRHLSARDAYEADENRVLIGDKICTGTGISRR